MKQYTHAWLPFKAIQRLQTVQLSTTNRHAADALVTWFMGHRDGVIRGAWYPDSLIHDNSTSHVMKRAPAAAGPTSFGRLPTTHRMYQDGQNSPHYQQPYLLEPTHNLPNRCEAITHSVIDNLRIVEREIRGSPVTPTNNHLALLMFMLSHYITDAHMPFHCDSRRFSSRSNIHGHLEGIWESEIETFYQIDEANERFFYDQAGLPARTNAPGYQNSFLAQVDLDLANRDFRVGYGGDSRNVLEFMEVICQYSYLASYAFIPQGFDETNVTRATYRNLQGQQYTVDQLSVIVFTDAIDSLAKVWLRSWRRWLGE
jgi:hypothetical protein